MTLTGICTLMMITTAVILFVDRTTEERYAQSTLKRKSKKIDIQETAATQVVAVFLFEEQTNRIYDILTNISSISTHNHRIIPL